MCDGPPHPTFPSFTALPPPNDYQALCVSPMPPCTGLADEIRFTVDADGNVLVPMDWLGVLVGERRAGGAPAPRHDRVRSLPRVRARPEGPIARFLGSFSPQGSKLPPIFEPQLTESEQLTLFGSADASHTVLRIARRSSAFRRCVGGADDGLPCLGAAGECAGGACDPAVCVGGGKDGFGCASDAECPGGECGPSLFDFRTRFHLGVGPVLIPQRGAGICQGGDLENHTCDSDQDCPASRCVRYRLEAMDPVQLEGLRSTTATFDFVIPEVIDGSDLNGDGDTSDDALTVVDRMTNQRRPIGAAPGVTGRAVVRVRQGPFSFPAVAADGNVVAFLESEPDEAGRDANGDGDVFDSIARVFSIGDGGATELSKGLTLTADAAPRIGGASLAAGEGFVAFRLPEWSAARMVTSLVSAAADGRPGNGASRRPAISADGRRIAFESDARNLHGSDGGGGTNVYVRDRPSGRTALASANAERSGAGNSASFAAALSADGGTVAFESRATDLVAADANGFLDDVFVAPVSFDDPLLLVPELASVSAGVQADRWSFRPALSGDGRLVAFESLATNLVTNGSNERRQLYLRDRGSGVVTLLSLPNKIGDLSSFAPVLSADGRFAAFETLAKKLAGTGADRKVILVSLADGKGELVSSFAGQRTANAASGHASLSADASVVAFESGGSDLVAGDTNGALDAFAFSADTGRPERVSVSSEGRQALGAVGGAEPSVSPDGRYVAFASLSGDLVPGDTNGDWDVFVRDRTTGATARVSVGPKGVEGNGYSVHPAIAAEGRFVAFETAASNLVAGDDNGVTDVVVRGPDPADTAADLTGDGDVDDDVLAVFEVPEGLRLLCPAAATAVSGDAIAFLRPESAGPAPGCPPGPDLNGDGDDRDSVAHLWSRGGAVADLHCAATAVALSHDVVAALVSEGGQGGVDLNGDGDTDDTVLEVLRRDAPLPASCDDWLAPSVGGRAIAADSLQVAGSLVAFLSPENGQGEDMNGDGDTVDRVVWLYDAASGELTDIGMAAEDFVLGETALAFRTRESAEGGADLNGDIDRDDDVLFVYSLRARCLLATRQAVTPCRLEACDPRVPYRVNENTVSFLTFEKEQGGADGLGTDLDGDGHADGLVLQSLQRAPGGDAVHRLRGRRRQWSGGAGALRGATRARPPSGRGDHSRRRRHRHLLDVGRGVRLEGRLPRRELLPAARKVREDHGRDLLRRFRRERWQRRLRHGCRRVPRGSGLSDRRGVGRPRRLPPRPRARVPQRRRLQGGRCGGALRRPGANVPAAGQPSRPSGDARAGLHRAPGAVSRTRAETAAWPARRVSAGSSAARRAVACATSGRATSGISVRRGRSAARTC